MNSKLLVFDGSNLFYRAYHGLRKQELRTKRGFGTWGIYGFLNSLSAIVRTQNPTHVLVAFDLGQSSFRLAIDTEYKGNRTKDRGEEYLESLSQLDTTKGLLNSLSFPWIEEEKVEADDLIAHAVTKHKNQVEEVVVVSGDHDLKQLVDKNVKMLKPALGGRVQQSEVWFTVEDIVSQYGVTPDRLCEIWALTGDSGDNVLGVKGIGEKTAVKLIKQYGSLSKLLSSDEKKIQGHEHVALKALKLVSLVDYECPVQTTELDSLDFMFWDPEHQSDSALELLEKLEMNTISERYRLGSLWRDPSVERKTISEHLL